MLHGAPTSRSGHWNLVVLPCPTWGCHGRCPARWSIVDGSLALRSADALAGDSQPQVTQNWCPGSPAAGPLFCINFCFCKRRSVMWARFCSPGAASPSRPPVPSEYAAGGGALEHSHAAAFSLGPRLSLGCPVTSPVTSPWSQAGVVARSPGPPPFMVCSARCWQCQGRVSAEQCPGSALQRSCGSPCHAGWGGHQVPQPGCEGQGLMSGRTGGFARGGCE